jgi:hypothetical protein
LEIFPVSFPETLPGPGIFPESVPPVATDELGMVEVVTLEIPVPLESDIGDVVPPVPAELSVGIFGCCKTVVGVIDDVS